MIKSGNIDKNLIGDYVNIDYPDRRQFPYDDTVNTWKSQGHLYVNYTGLLREEYRGVPDWCHSLVKELKKEIEFRHSSLSVYCMPPGTIMPEHRDYYTRYRKINNLNQNDKVGRFLIFLEDWKSGHYFELNRSPIVNWSKGDYYFWVEDSPHIAANIGIENRYTMQVTVVL